jgi:CTP-dependent riboflavin kinase
MNQAEQLFAFLAQHQSFSDEEKRLRLETLEQDERIERIVNQQGELTGIIEQNVMTILSMVQVRT